jgi:hypothetical protein
MPGPFSVLTATDYHYRPCRKHHRLWYDSVTNPLFPIRLYRPVSGRAHQRVEDPGYSMGDEINPEKEADDP